MDLKLKLNGNDYIHQQLFYGGAQNKGSNAWYNPFYMNVCVNITSGSDYIELYMYQNVGSNVEVNAQGTNLDTFWYGFRIGA